MKITSRERNLWLCVIGLIGCFVIYRVITFKSESSETSGNTMMSLSEAQQLLRSEPNIIARHQAVKKQLEGLYRRFYDDFDTETAKLALLQLIEGLATDNGLNVERKNLIDFGEGLIAMSLEGTASPEALFGLMQHIAVAEIGLVVKRLQVHSNIETRTLKYQLIIATQLVKAGKAL